MCNYRLGISVGNLKNSHTHSDNSKEILWAHEGKKYILIEIGVKQRAEERTKIKIE